MHQVIVRLQFTFSCYLSFINLINFLFAENTINNFALPQAFHMDPTIKQPDNLIWVDGLLSLLI
jgi:hypothetical protein